MHLLQTPKEIAKQLPASPSSSIVATCRIEAIRSVGIEDGALDPVLAQPVAHDPAAGLVVVELPVEFGVQKMGVEVSSMDLPKSMPATTVVDGVVIPAFLFFAIRDYVPTLPFTARSNGCNGPTTLQDGFGNPSDSRLGPLPAGGHSQAHRRNPLPRSKGGIKVEGAPDARSRVCMLRRCENRVP